MKKILPLVIVFLIGHAVSYPYEVPLIGKICETMTPGHTATKSQDLTQPIPYIVNLSKTKITNGNTVQVTLIGKEDAYFKGFYLQCRSSSGVPIGTFTPPNETVKVHKCGKGNAIFHGSTGSRNNVTVTWTPNQGFKGNANFLATFVQSYDMYWVQVPANSKLIVS